MSFTLLSLFYEILQNSGEIQKKNSKTISKTTSFSVLCSPLQRDSDRRYMMAEDELLEPIDFTLATPETMPIPVALRELVISFV